MNRFSARYLLLASILSPTLSFVRAQSSVKLIKSVDLARYTGDFDHFAVDYNRSRLLLAAEDHGTAEFFDLKTSAHPDHLKLLEKVTTAPGAKTGLLLPDLHRLFLAVSPGESKAVAKVLTYEVK
jgi:hypothetical protein